MKKQPNTSPIEDFEWRNWHATRGVGGQVEVLFTPRNTWLSGGSKKHRFEPGISALQEIVRQAERDNKRVRAVGSGWSLNNIAFTEEYLVNTARLSELFIGFKTETMLTAKYRARKQRMVFAQCGTQIKVLNAYLERQRLCLPTSGASNGQTLAGAVSTGTHGSAVSVGSMQDYILAVHLVSEGGEHHLIQRKSNAAASPEFSRWLGAKHVLDDELFNAVVVGFGSFGLVHGYLFEAEPIYVLEKQAVKKDYADVIVPMTTLDVSSLGLPRPELPFHFEVDLNPYRLAHKEGGAFVRYMYKRTLKAKEPIPEPQGPPAGVQTSEDLVAIAGVISDAVPEAIPHLLQSELEDAVGLTTKPVIKTPGQMFSDSMRTNGGNSIEIGVPLDRVGEAVGLILGVYQGHTFGAPLALRYVKASAATLAFTHFAPTTCAMEMPGIDSRRTREAFGQIQRLLAKSDIPHSYHWGQQLPLDASWVIRAFGARRDAWLAARRNFLSPRGRALFANAVIARCGLAS